MTKLLTTSEFAKALGVGESSIRRMADSGDVQIHRTRGGHRRIPVSAAVRYVRETQTQVERPDLLRLDIDVLLTRQDQAKEKMLEVLRAGHASSAISLMQSLYAGGMSIAELCDGPISHAMSIIGAAWPHDKKAIFIEHRAVILCCRALSQLRLSIPEPGRESPAAIGGAMAGDQYLLPTLMASLVLHELGWNETNLGPNLPLDVLMDCVEDERPAMVWLAIGEPIRSRTQLSEIRKLSEVANRYDSQLIVGGRHAAEVRVSLGDTCQQPPTFCSTMACLQETVVETTRSLDKSA